MKLRTRNLDVLINDITKFGGGAAAYLDGVMHETVQHDLYPQWITTISLNDHSKEELDELGNPYAVRYPVDSFVHPDEMVHEQSGELISASRVEAMHASGGSGWGITNSSPHYVHLRFGTYKMRMRDPAAAAFRVALPMMKKRILAAIKGYVKISFKEK